MLQDIEYLLQDLQYILQDTQYILQDMQYILQDIQHILQNLLYISPDIHFIAHLKWIWSPRHGSVVEACTLKQDPLAQWCLILKGEGQFSKATILDRCALFLMIMDC